MTLKGRRPSHVERYSLEPTHDHCQPKDDSGKPAYDFREPEDDPREPEKDFCDPIKAGYSYCKPEEDLGEPGQDYEAVIVSSLGSEGGPRQERRR
jgi:hypothetical protein